MGTKLIRIGRVSSINPSNCTARVVFNDEDAVVSDELPIITMASNQTKAYWLPEIDTQVLCIFLPNTSGRGINQGYVLGAFYSDVDKAPANGADIHTVHFKDGSKVTSDGNGNLEVTAPGKIIIKAEGQLVLQGATVNIN